MLFNLKLFKYNNCMVERGCLMPNQALVNYIVQQLNIGFKAEQISQHLINNRYSRQDVNDAIAVAQKSAVNYQATQPSLQSQQTGTVQIQTTSQPQLQSQASQQIFQPQLPTADPRLVSYITQQRNSGFDQNSIRNYLLKYGYAAQQIDPGIDTVFHPVAASTGKHITHLGAIIVSVIVLVSVFSGAGLFFFFQFSQDNNIEDQLMDYTVKATKTSLLPGDTLSFEISMDNKGNDKRYDVELSHMILNTDQEEIDSIQETVAVETTTEQVAEIKVPENIKPGKYKLFSKGVYGDKEVSASFTFEVKGADSGKGDDTEKQPKVDQPTKVDSSKKTDRKPQSATQQPKTDTPEKTQPASQPSTQPSTDDKIPAKDAKAQPDEDEQKVSIDEIEADVRTKAADPSKISEADALCQTLTTQNEKDYCYSDIAEVSKQKQYCDKINHQYRRDVCYLNNFMEKGDYSVCDVIIDYELNLACKEQAKRTVTLTQIFPQPLTQITTTISPLGSDSTTSSDVPASGSATTSDGANTPSDDANNTNELTNAQNTTQANEESQN